MSDRLLWVHYPDGCVSDEFGDLPLAGDEYGQQDGKACVVDLVIKLEYDPADDDDELGPAWDVFLKLKEST